MANLTVDMIKHLVINEPNFNMHQLKSLLLGKQTNTSKYANISDYELKINYNQQYARLPVIRIHGLNIPQAKIECGGVRYACMTTAYDRILRPVIEKLTPRPEDLPAGEPWGPELLDRMPSYSELIGNAHFVGEETVDKEGRILPRCVILRFQSAYFKNLFMKIKN